MPEIAAGHFGPIDNARYPFINFKLNLKGDISQMDTLRRRSDRTSTASQLGIPILVADSYMIAELEVI